MDADADADIDANTSASVSARVCARVEVRIDSVDIAYFYTLAYMYRHRRNGYLA